MNDTIRATTSKGFKLKYVLPGRNSLSICNFGVRTESLSSIALTCKRNKVMCIIMTWVKSGFRSKVFQN